MFFVREFTVCKHERGLLFRNGDFVRFLAPAVYRFFDPHTQFAVERFDLSEPTFEHRLSDYLVRWHPEAVEDQFLRVETGASQVGVIAKNGHPWNVVGPESRALFWKGVVHVKAEIIDIGNDIAVPSRVARAVLAARRRSRTAFEEAVAISEIPEGHVGLLYVDGRFVRAVAPGVHAFWKFDRNVNIVVVDSRLKSLSIVGHELRTCDRVGIRVAATVNYRFADAPRAIGAVRDPTELARKDALKALRAAVARRSLAALLEDADSAGDDICSHLRGRLDPLGIEIRSVTVEDIEAVDV